MEPTKDAELSILRIWDKKYNLDLVKWNWMKESHNYQFFWYSQIIDFRILEFFTTWNEQIKINVSFIHFVAVTLCWQLCFKIKSWFHSCLDFPGTELNVEEYEQDSTK